MALLLAAALVGGVVSVGYGVALREPTEPVAVALVLVGFGLVAFAVSSAALHYVGRQLGRGPRQRRTGASLRRGMLVGVGVTTLAFLRVVDALSAVTAVFVLAALAALEGALAARG